MDSFRPADAPGVVEVMRAVYGESYPFPLVYDPAYWVDQNASDELFTYVARTAEGRVAGICSFFRAAPFPGLYEYGQLVLHPDFRGTRVGGDLAGYCLDCFREEPVGKGGFTEVGCHWTLSQRLAVKAGFDDTAMAPGLFSAETYAREHDVKGRVSAMMGFLNLRDRAHTVHLGGPWEALLAWLYQGLGLDRAFSSERAPLSGSSRIKAEYMEEPKLARLDAAEPGADLGEQLARLEQTHAQAAVVQLRLPLEDPRSPAAVEAAAARGYLPCGLLPRWFDGDAVLLQLNREAPGPFEANQIYSERGRQLNERLKNLWT